MSDNKTYYIMGDGKKEKRVFIVSLRWFIALWVAIAVAVICAMYLGWSLGHYHNVHQPVPTCQKVTRYATTV